MKVFLNIVLLSISFLANGQSPVSPLPDSLQNCMDTVLNTVQSKRVDWKVIRDSANRLVANAKNIKDMMPAVEYMFTAIGDYHGALIYKGQRYGMQAIQITVRDDLDVSIIDGDNFADLKNDKKIKASLDWLKSD